jgi:hypothetical protein
MATHNRRENYGSRTGRVIALILLVGGVIPGVAACGQSCTAVHVYGLSVMVRDLRTGGPVDGVTAILTDGDYREVVVPRDAGAPITVVDSGIPRITAFSFAAERRGNYTLRLSAPGYQPSGPHYVRVTGDACHPHPVELVVDMVPL